MYKHSEFILSPITGILKEVVSANAGIGNGIETYPLSEYILQSVFLKMTGFQEQKMKCICWELASNDYEYRYKRYTLSPLGECSSYQDKMAIYKDLIALIKKHRANFDIATGMDKNNIRTSAIAEITDLCSSSNLSSWAQSSFWDFVDDSTLIPLNQFASVHNLFENVLQEKYTLLYNHRNRCAHNTQSYQENLPTLKTLFNTDHRYDNYFVRFALLNLIDKIFVELYRKYIEVLEES